jgi:hypothetical protein
VSSPQIAERIARFADELLFFAARLARSEPADSKLTASSGSRRS